MDKKKEAFYRKFVVNIVEDLANNSVLDNLVNQGIITTEERYDQIKDLSTRENRREFWKIMQTK